MLFEFLQKRCKLFFICNLIILACILFTGKALASPDFEQEDEQIVFLNSQGDLPTILENHTLRVLVSYDNVGFFMDKGRQDGLYVSLVKKFVSHLKKKYLTAERMKIYFIPVREDEMMNLIAEGKGDIAMGISPTQEYKRFVDFTIPEKLWLKEIFVVKNSDFPINSLNDLANRVVWVRKSSSYYESLQLLNDYLKAHKLAPVTIVEADEYLTDVDLVDMVSKGEIPATVVNDSKIVIWKKFFDNISFYVDVPIKVNGTLNWAIRHNSPKLYKEANLFLRKYRDGTPEGTKIYDRYMRTHSTYNSRVASNNHMQLGISADKFKKFSKIFQKYGKHYDIDWILLMAQSYQESTLNPDARSARGAVGIMQVLPTTAQEWYIGIQGVNELDNNVHAGTKYMRYIIDAYFNEPEIQEVERLMLALAAYNSGPNRITRYRDEARIQGLNPNIWFGNVENIAVNHGATETVNYVKNIAELYISYQEVYRMNSSKEQFQDTSYIIPLRLFDLLATNF